MGKIIDLSAVMEKEEKLEQIADYMGELKDEFAALIRSLTRTAQTRENWILLLRRWMHWKTLTIW